MLSDEEITSLATGIAEIREFALGFMTEDTDIQTLETYEDEDDLERTRLVTRESTKSFAMPVGQRELLRAQQAGIEVESRRFLPAGTVVSEDDVLVVDEQKWSVTGIPEFTEELSAHVEVYLRRRT
jgi:hypothetical protein